jgi:transposase InsO family protein
MERKKRRQYTPMEQAAVVRDVDELGVVGAAKKHDVPQSCVSRWACAARDALASAAKSEVTQAPEAVAAMQPLASGTPATVASSDNVQARDSLGTKPVLAEPPPAAAKSKPGSRVAKLYTPSQKAQVLEHAAAHGVTAAAEKFDISRFSIYEWQRKLEKAAKGEGPSPTSGPAPADIEAQRDQEILAQWHKHPGLGPSQIANQLRRDGIKVAVHTVRRVMEDAGYRPPKVKREPHDERYEAVRPNHLWHLDFIQRYINRTSTFTLILIDDHSRFVTGHGVDDAERADMVVRTFEQAVARHGRPERVMNDKGSAFWSWRGISRFTELITEMGIDQVVAEHKEWNGKVEVFNANLHKELFDVHRFYDLADMRRRLAAHLHWYNHSRTHHALGGLLVPADRFYGRVEEVLARIEAGAGRDAKDLLDLRDRCLELFKVTSRAGVPEVWLLGQRLLPGTAST